MTKLNLLLSTNDIIHLLSKKLNLNFITKGKNIFFICPFHADKNPSLSLENQYKIFTCFSCGFKAKNVFELWSKYQNITVEESIKEISELGFSEKLSSFLTNVVNENDYSESKKLSSFTLVVDIYQHNLLTKEGGKILSYLKNERKIDQKLIEKFSLGCAIKNQQISRLIFDQNNKNSQNLLIKNLIKVSEKNLAYDFFLENQLIIPLINQKGEIVSLAARKVNENEEKDKYIYLPNYQNYSKSSLIYNYFSVKKNIKEECYLVEGFFDVISLTKLGKENSIALLGTSISEEQIKLLRNLKKRIVLFLDNDNAGQNATINIAVKLLKNEIDCEMVKNNLWGDPDEICQKIDSEKIDDILKNRENPFIFIINNYFHKFKVEENPQRENLFVRELAKIFYQFKQNTKDFIIKKIAQLIKWDKTEIEENFSSDFIISNDFSSNGSNDLEIIENLTEKQKLIESEERKIICLCAKERDFWIIAEQFINYEKYFFSTKINRKIYRLIFIHYSKSPENFSFNNLSEISNSFIFNNKDLEKSSSIEKIKYLKGIFNKIEEIKLDFSKNN